MAKGKVQPIKKKFQPNIALFIFLLIVVYVIVLGIGYYMKDHISIYEVNTSEISDDTPLYGFILRSEEVMNTAEDGYINYYNAEGTRVGKGDVIYTIDSNGEVSSMLEQLQKTNATADTITSIRDIISSFQNNSSLANYSQVSDFKHDVNNVLLEQSRGTLYSDLNKALKSSGKSKSFTKITSQKSGVISYSIDGYEGISQDQITSEILDEYGKATRKQIQSEEITKAGSPVYKLVTSNDWSFIVKLNDDYYNQLKSLDFVKVTVEKDDISFNAAVALYEKDGCHFARLSTSRYMEHYINDRFLKIEFNLKRASGLKIPNSSILEKEYYVLPAEVITKGDSGNGVIKRVMDEKGKPTKQFVSLGDSEFLNGKYYVKDSVVSGGDIVLNMESGEDYIVSSKEKLYGVYCVNQGFCEFRPINIQYQNKEYTIVSDTTSGGLAAYDHIVVDPKNLNDDDFID